MKFNGGKSDSDIQARDPKRRLMTLMNAGEKSIARIPRHIDGSPRRLQSNSRVTIALSCLLACTDATKTGRPITAHTSSPMRYVTDMNEARNTLSPLCEIHDFPHIPGTGGDLQIC